MQPARLRLGQLLVDAHILSADQLEQVLAKQKSDGRRLGTLLVESGLVSETQLTQILSQQLSVPWVSLCHIDFSRELLALIPREMAEKYCLVPIYARPVRGQGDTLYVAMEDPMNEEALRDCTVSSGLPARAMIAAPTDIIKAIGLYYGGAPSGPAPKAVAVAAPEEAPLPKEAAPADSSPSAATEADLPAPPSAPPAAPAEAAAASNEAAPETPTTPASVRPAPAAPASVPPVQSQNGLGIEHGATTAAAEEPPISSTPPTLSVASHDDAPTVEFREIERPKRKRGLELTLLDGTTIKVPVNRKRRPEPPGERAAGEFTAADVLAALRAAAQGGDPGEVLGDKLRWEKMAAVILSLLLRKHLILEKELIEELRKI